MNKHDRNQYLFIMELSDSEFDNWSRSLSNDDLQYALELIQAARVELVEQEQALMEADLEESNFDEARAVLQKFML
jgi:hypothetical protein